MEITKWIVAYLYCKQSTNTNMYKIFWHFPIHFRQLSRRKLNFASQTCFGFGLILTNRPCFFLNFRSVLQTISYNISDQLYVYFHIFFRKTINYHSLKIFQSTPHKHSCLSKGCFIQTKFPSSLIRNKNYFSKFSSESERVCSKGTM